MAKAKKGKSAGKAAKPAEMLLVSSKVHADDQGRRLQHRRRRARRSQRLRRWLVAQAAKRASENGRKTVRAHDFIIM